MLNEKECIKIEKEIKQKELARDKTIQQVSEIIKLSKSIIYDTHRDNLSSAESKIIIIEKKVKDLPRNTDTSSPKIALQEFVEAITFYYYMRYNKLPKLSSFSKFNVDTEAYLLGLCDLSGELVRKAINLAIKEKFKEAINIKDLVSEIYWFFMKLDLRNSELRKKSDQIKWNLKKLEDVSWDIQKMKRGK